LYFLRFPRPFLFGCLYLFFVRVERGTNVAFTPRCTILARTDPKECFWVPPVCPPFVPPSSRLYAYSVSHLFFSIFPLSVLLSFCPPLLLFPPCVLPGALRDFTPWPHSAGLVTFPLRRLVNSSAFPSPPISFPCSCYSS